MLSLADRLLTIAVTATLTSAAWIILAPTYVDMGRAGPAGGGGGGGEAALAPAPEGADAGGGGAAGERARLFSAPGGALAVPVLNVRPEQLVNTYADARAGGERQHEALDIAAPTGTPVVAAAPGRVERLFESEEGGKTVYVRSADAGTIYYYAHLDGYAPQLREGQSVSRGQPLGTVGATGNADPAAPHLHFAVLRTSPAAEWWEPGTPLNPYPLLVE